MKVENAIVLLRVNFDGIVYFRTVSFYAEESSLMTFEVFKMLGGEISSIIASLACQ